MKILVVCGGQGTKLWPYSRQDKPKQFQPIIGDISSYQLCIETLLTAYPAEDVFISTKHKFIKYISEQSPQIPLKNYIIEPDIALDRGPAEGLAFMRLSMLFPDEPVFYVQGDMVREPGEKFIELYLAKRNIQPSGYFLGKHRVRSPCKYLYLRCRCLHIVQCTMGLSHNHPLYAKTRWRSGTTVTSHTTHVRLIKWCLRIEHRMAVVRIIAFLKDCFLRAPQKHKHIYYL